MIGTCISNLTVLGREVAAGLWLSGHKKLGRRNGPPSQLFKTGELQT